MPASSELLSWERCLDILRGWNHEQDCREKEQMSKTTKRKERNEKKLLEKHTWIQNNPAYTAWTKRVDRQLDPDADESLRIWITGAGSTARTELALSIRQELRRPTGYEPRRIQLLFSSANRQNEHGNTPSTMIKTFLYHLLRIRQDLCKELRE
jgi:hypothetical protein